MPSWLMMHSKKTITSLIIKIWSNRLKDRALKVWSMRLLVSVKSCPKLFRHRLLMRNQQLHISLRWYRRLLLIFPHQLLKLPNQLRQFRLMSQLQPQRFLIIHQQRPNQPLFRLWASQLRYQIQLQLINFQHLLKLNKLKHLLQLLKKVMQAQTCRAL